MKTNLRRRDELKAMLAPASAPMVLPGRILGANAPSKRVTLGFIGMGGQRTGNNLNNFLNLADAQAVAVCDVVEARIRAAQDMVNQRYKNRDCKGCTDFRKIIDDAEANAMRTVTYREDWQTA